MDQQTIMEIATAVTKLKMYPYFDVASYILMCMIVREDNHPQATGSQLFSRKHPLSCWVASMMLCFAGSILGNLLVGEPLVVPFKNHQDLLTASVVWYLINYSPFDLVYKLCRFAPFKLAIACLKEVQRVNKIHHGVLLAAKLYPGSYVVIALIGLVKGSAANHMRLFQRVVCGMWSPTQSEFLKPSFITKGSLLAAIVFILERKGMISAPHAMIYFGVVVFFVYFRLSSLLLGIHDPFLPFENLFCALFMGGMWDALMRAVTREKKTEENDVRNNGFKSHEDKKRD